MANLNRYNSTFPSLIDNLFSRDWMDWNNSNYSNTNTTLPAVNISENDNEFGIEVAAPGMKKSDFSINLDNNQLTISSNSMDEKEKKPSNYTKREFSYQSFKRSFTLPEGTIDGDKIKARYTDGILYITLPKREEVKPKPPKEISIS